MDEVDGWLIAMALAALSASLWLIALRVRSLELDMEWARITAPVRTGGND